MACNLTKKTIVKLLHITAVLMVSMAIFSGTSASDKKAKHLEEESKKCLKCHAQAIYMLTDSTTGDSVKMKMYAELRIDPVIYLNSTHGAFKCTGCHSSDYNSFPHPVSVKFEADYTCLDCHGGDEQYASFHFETIEEEYAQSVHAERLGSDYSCWSCHNPHTYKLTGPKEKVVNKVAVDNGMCLNCHGNAIKFANLADKEIPNLINRHDWLPNQTLHFKKVRCIDCHAAQNDSLMVAHLIKPSKNAVRKCVECHSTNSILMTSLYKHDVQEKRNQLGFYNGVITNEAYIIGANRNYYLNVASIAIFLLTLLGIAFHTTIRIINSRRNANK